MAKRLYEENNIQDLANAIREKNGSTDKYKVSHMAGKVRELEARKPEQEKTLDVVSVGTTEVLPDEGKVLNKVTVNVNLAGAPPANALISFTDYDDTGLPRTLIYNCPDTITQERLFHGNTSYNGFFSTAIKKVIMPNHVTTINKMTFGGLSYLEELTNWDYITYIDSSAFALNNGTFDKGRTLQHTYFPPNLTYIGDSAFFRNAKYFVSEIPDTVTYIGKSAFTYGGNSNMTFTKLPPNLTYIGDSAFMGYFIFESLDIPSTVDYVGPTAFDGRYHKTSLKSVKFRGIPTTIGNTAFAQNTSLADIYVPWAEGAVANAPWGATNATIHYNTTYDADGNPVV